MFRLKRAAYIAGAALFPVNCPFCGILLPPDGLICEGCYARLSLIDGYDVPDGFDEMAACYEYTGEIRDAILRFKAGGDSHAAVAFSAVMAECCSPFLDDVDVITAIPSSYKSLLRRGYMPAVALAKGISVFSGKPYRKTMAACGERVEQKRLNRSQRIENAKNSMIIVNKSYISGKNILLVDDVCTTGSTMSAAARLMRQNGAHKVYGVAFAMVPLR